MRRSAVLQAFYVISSSGTAVDRQGMRKPANFFDTVRAFMARWSESRCTSRAAALSFYSAFSLAPILVIVLTAGSTFVDAGLLGSALLGEVERLMGNQGKVLVSAMLETARQRTSGSYAIVAGFIVLVGATTAFAELKDALDDILRAGMPGDRSVWQTLRARLLSFGLVLTLAFLLLVALIANAAIRAVTRFAATRLGWESLCIAWRCLGNCHPRRYISALFRDLQPSASTAAVTMPIAVGGYSHHRVVHGRSSRYRRLSRPLECVAGLRGGRFACDRFTLGVPRRARISRWRSRRERAACFERRTFETHRPHVGATDCWPWSLGSYVRIAATSGYRTSAWAR
jgi:hypothetical protein